MTLFATRRSLSRVFTHHNQELRATWHLHEGSWDLGARVQLSVLHKLLVFFLDTFPLNQ